MLVSGMKMKYTVVRGYSNCYGMDELVRRIVRRHMKYARPKNAVKKCLDYEVDAYARKENA